MKRNIVETIIGALVLVVAIGFFTYAYNRTAIQTVSGYTVIAVFDAVGGLTEGADVRISGIKVGSVLRQEIDPTNYMAKVTLSVDPRIKLTTDASAKIATEGLLGGNYVAIDPGGADTVIEANGQITYTQGAIDLIALLAAGSVFNQKPAE